MIEGLDDLVVRLKRARDALDAEPERTFEALDEVRAALRIAADIETDEELRERWED